MNGEITELLVRWQQGDNAALEPLSSAIYHELHKLGRIHLQRLPKVTLLGPTALVHETWLRLNPSKDDHFRSRGEFYALASHIMRGILVDETRKKFSMKRGRGQVHVSLEEVDPGNQNHILDLLILDELLSRLSRMKARSARIVEMKFFGGLKIPEIAELLGISRATVEREWTFARLWLLREFQNSSAKPENQSESP